jgi:hypothetical protein
MAGWEAGEAGGTGEMEEAGKGQLSGGNSLPPALPLRTPEPACLPLL